MMRDGMLRRKKTKKRRYDDLFFMLADGFSRRSRKTPHWPRPMRRTGTLDGPHLREDNDRPRPTDNDGDRRLSPKKRLIFLSAIVPKKRRPFLNSVCVGLLFNDFGNPLLK
ncbi:unnamed protein product [Nippostrongylus brasiliensis]|uniref:Uncharacterized protein n=1 Tax=Nippostrongylus brasiliensis TaxID=27835 RepID=A0A0N4YL25_NIPBR|nr:unnamed protein product [Nippostrongylus brasiliensis]